MEEIQLEIVQDDDPRNATFIFMNEDHTLGNSLRSILANDPDVAFVGYSVPHPFETKMHLRVQSSLKPARTVLLTAVQKLQEQFVEMRAKYISALQVNTSGKI
ncbi:MAG: DNA-directed RNA polymerases I and III subunit RPAC2 [Streblomastix strix]|uniref:DNA-directed RNA polymerases I and III subunit RPAC2 n=1 Tax=Streblomastix strix TaxID=222440 RepID=A0A5J4WR20_9EUKA|nr:MAG: DNA-directed RNA polymerases I and III subunit RPAC2 [Streblomastix strix]